MLSESWYRENMPRYKAAFEDGTIEIPKDADVLGDHRAIVLENGIAKMSERRAGSDGKGRHGDSAMAAALAFFASRTDAGQIEYLPVQRVAVKREFEARRNPFGGPPIEDDNVVTAARGF